jgi:2-polyprenyl-3-methyl-5-hydroxy-6-metoxy-1,4-benzoquinol methylase
MTRRFDQADYWRQRHRNLAGDPRSVGNLGRSVEENRASEAKLKNVVDRAAMFLSPARSVLDVGCGYGRVADCFTARGYRYLGVDISEDAVQEARRRHPDAEFMAADLASWDTERRFDVVVVLYVFVHFVDESRWLSLLRRTMSWVEPGGALLIADQFPAERTVPGPHVVARPLETYVPVLRSGGFELDPGFRHRLIGQEEDELPNAWSFHLARRLPVATDT